MAAQREATPSLPTWLSERRYSRRKDMGRIESHQGADGYEAIRANELEVPSPSAIFNWNITS